MRPIIMVVMDAISWEFVNKHLNDLPTFKYLTTKYQFGILHNNIEGRTARATTTFESSVAIYTGKINIDSMWVKKFPPHIKTPRQRTRKEIIVPLIWELIPNSIALRTILCGKNSIYYNCPRITLPPALGPSLSFPTSPHNKQVLYNGGRKIINILANKSYDILKKRNPSFFTVLLEELDIPSHYLWTDEVAKKYFPELKGLKLIYFYQDTDNLLKKILPFLENSWFVVCGNHGFGRFGTKKYRPKGHPAITGDHRRDSIIITNMDLAKNLTDIFPMILKYAKREKMI